MLDKNKPIPTEQVMGMRRQGLTDNQIIQSLQQQGFNSNEVLDALEFADHTPATQDLSPPTAKLANPMENSPPPLFQNKPEPIPPPMNQPIQNQPPTLQSNEPKRDEEIEELIEAIIEEKWADVEKDIDRLLDWKNGVDEKLTTIKAEIDSMKTSFDELHKAVIGKVGDYDKNILEVGSQLKAMEQVFSKVLPKFTDNVAELSRITERARKFN